MTKLQQSTRQQELNYSIAIKSDHKRLLLAEIAQLDKEINSCLEERETLKGVL